MLPIQPLLWMVAAGTLLTMSVRVVEMPASAWISVAAMAYAVRALPSVSGLLCTALTIYAAMAAGLRGVVPVPYPIYFAAVAPLVIALWMPLAIDRIVGPRIAGWASTLVLPAAFVTVELLSSRLSPWGSNGSLAYTQHGNLALLQVVSVTGIFGVTFLVAWSASVVSWSAVHGFDWPTIRTGVTTCAAVLAVTLVAGGVRLSTAPSDRRTVRAASVSFPRELFQPGEVTRIYEGRVPADALPRAKRQIAQLHDFLFDQARREARAGAQLVAFPETNLVVLRDDEAAVVDRARRLAQEERVTLAMGMGTVTLGAPRPLENKVVLIDPAGLLEFSYRKSLPVPGWEASIMEVGDGRLPVHDSAIGRIGAAICFEGDHPQFVRQIGQAGTALWVLPTNDWPEVKRGHYQLAAFRAIENGTPMLRAGSSGFSGAFDPWGRALGVTDHYSGARTMVAQVPVGGVRTIYARTGDWFAWLCVAALVGLLARAATS
jgi:apolipoprotein N-acyltransferase